MFILTSAFALPVLTPELEVQDAREEHAQRLDEARRALEQKLAKGCPATALPTRRWGSVAPKQLQVRPALAKESCSVEPEAALAREVECVDALNGAEIDAYIAARGWTLEAVQPATASSHSPAAPGSSPAVLGPAHQGTVVASLVNPRPGASTTLTQAHIVRLVRTSGGEALLVHFQPEHTVTRATTSCTAWAGMGTPPPPTFTVYTLPDPVESIPLQRHDVPVLAAVMVVPVDHESACCVP